MSEYTWQVIIEYLLVNAHIENQQSKLALAPPFAPECILIAV